MVETNLICDLYDQKKHPTEKIKFLHQGHLLIRVQQRSKHNLVKVVHVVVALYLLPNNNWPKEQCGIKNASIVPNVIVHWTRHWLVMVPIVKSIAVHVTPNSLDQKASYLKHCNLFKSDRWPFINNKHTFWITPIRFWLRPLTNFGFNQWWIYNCLVSIRI